MRLPNFLKNIFLGISSWDSPSFKIFSLGASRWDSPIFGKIFSWGSLVETPQVLKYFPWEPLDDTPQFFWKIFSWEYSSWDSPSFYIFSRGCFGERLPILGGNRVGTLGGECVRVVPPRCYTLMWVSNVLLSIPLYTWPRPLVIHGRLHSASPRRVTRLVSYLDVAWTISLVFLFVHLPIGIPGAGVHSRTPHPTPGKNDSSGKVVLYIHWFTLVILGYAWCCAIARTCLLIPRENRQILLPSLIDIWFSLGILQSWSGPVCSFFVLQSDRICHRFPLNLVVQVQEEELLTDSSCSRRTSCWLLQWFQKILYLLVKVLKEIILFIVCSVQILSAQLFLVVKNIKEVQKTCSTSCWTISSWTSFLFWQFFFPFQLCKFFLLV